MHSSIPRYGMKHTPYYTGSLIVVCVIRSMSPHYGTIGFNYLFAHESRAPVTWSSKPQMYALRTYFYYSYHTQLQNPRYILQIGSWESVSTPLLLEYFSRCLSSKGLPDSPLHSFHLEGFYCNSKYRQHFSLTWLKHETTCRRYLGWSYRIFKAIVI